MAKTNLCITDVLQMFYEFCQSQFTTVKSSGSKNVRV